MEINIVRRENSENRSGVHKFTSQSDTFNGIMSTSIWITPEINVTMYRDLNFHR